MANKFKLMGLLLCFAALALTTISCSKENDENERNETPREDIRYTMWYGENEYCTIDLFFNENTYQLEIISTDYTTYTIYKGQYTYFKGSGSLVCDAYNGITGHHIGNLGTGTFTVSGNNLTLKIEFGSQEYHLEFEGENYTPLK